MNYDELLNEMCNGKKSMGILAAAGYGKTTLVKEMQKRVPTGVVYAATTGMAAFGIYAVTVHSAFGLGPHFQVVNQPVKISDYKQKFLKAAHTILIDESSLLRIDVIDRINTVLQSVFNNKEPFGGRRIIFIADIFQLGTVCSPIDLPYLQETYKNADGDYSFYNAPVFKDTKLLDKFTWYELQHNFRQSSDPDYGTLLSLIRIGTKDDAILGKLNSRVLEPPEHVTILTASNFNADRYNKEQMFKLNDPNPVVSFSKIEPKTLREQVMGTQNPMTRDLEIKNGMQIMFVKNDSERNGRRWVNGTTGIIVKKPICSDKNLKSVMVDIAGRQHEIFREETELFRPGYNYKTQRIEITKMATITQFPFMPCWATTIHKSQGRTLDAAFIDYEGFGLSHGQVYTGLSRTRSIRDVYLQRQITKDDIVVSDKVVRFYESIMSNMVEVNYEPKTTSNTKNND